MSPLRIVITTSPRQDGADYLLEMLRSLRTSVPVELFSDPGKAGARWNTWQALGAASRRNPPERLLLMQDDVVASPDLVDVATHIEIPDDVGVVSFHDCGDDFHWEVPPPGVHKFPAHRIGSHGLIGAQCLLFPATHAAWLAAQDMNAPPVPGPHSADYAIGWWTAKSSRPNKLIVSPAMVRHIGERSACHPDRRAAGAPIPHAGRTFVDFITAKE